MHQVANGSKFPSGMRTLSDKLSAMGIGLGVYTDIGDRSCGHGPGSFGHYQQDANTFALQWNVSYLKVDDCSDLVDPTEQLLNWGKLRTYHVGDSRCA